MRLLGLAGAPVLVAMLSACVGGGKADYATQCTFEVKPPGSYSYPAGVNVPTAVPAEGGTQAGAAALNACIRRKAGGSP